MSTPSHPQGKHFTPGAASSRGHVPNLACTQLQRDLSWEPTLTVLLFVTSIPWFSSQPSHLMSATIVTITSFGLHGDKDLFFLIPGSCSNLYFSMKYVLTKCTLKG